MKKKWLISGGVIFIVVSLALIINNKNNSTLELKEGNIKKSNSNMVAINVSEDGINYTSQKDIPVGDYTFNTEKSKCRVPDSSLNGKNAPVDEGVTIEYTDGKLNFLGLTKNDTKCYVYFYKTPDTEAPTISNVATTVTKTEINVTVTASDNNGVTEYWYQLDSGTEVKETTNTHTFTGLTAGQTYSLKVWVKDAAGNSSEVTTKSVTTTPNGQTAETIIAAIEARTDGSYKGTTTPTFGKVATSAETAANNGIYKVADGMYGGYAYYWRGAATTNYVNFANSTWRIIRINGDKTIRLIYSGQLSNVQYNSSSDPAAVGYTYINGEQRTLGGNNSTVKTAIDNWYNSNLSSYDNHIAYGKFCNDRNIPDGEFRIKGTVYYGARSRNGSTPTTSCPSGDVYTLKAGMITLDDAQFAGASGSTANTSYYLYNGKYYWTMSPSDYTYNKDIEMGYPSVYLIHGDNGRLNSTWNVSSSKVGVRPVINLRSDTLFNEGSDGTKNNPYIVQ